MANITAAQLKTTIEAGLVTDSVTGVQVFDFPRDVSRRKYPSIEIKATQPDGSEADPRVTRISQKFDVAIRVKPRGGGSDDIAALKAIENSVFTALDATALGQTQIFVLNKSWGRQGEVVQKPIRHYLSILSVLTTDITSTTGVGQIIQDLTVSFPNLANMKILGKPTERETETMESVYNVRRVRVEMAPISDARTWFGEVEYTDARMTELRTQRNARAKISFTVTRPSGDEVLGGKIIGVDHGGVIADVESIAIAVEVF